MRNNIIVNRIPSLTWNRLQVNEAVVNGTNVKAGGVETRFEALPDGVTQSQLTFEEAGKWLAEHAPQQSEEAVVAGKAPIYHPQAFATGLGEGFDHYLAKSGQETELFTVAEGVSVAEPIRWDIVFHAGNQAVTSQIIHVAKNASLTLVMSWSSEETDEDGLVGVSTKVVLEEGAHLTLVKSQMLGMGFTSLDDTGASLEKDAQMTLIQMSLGGGKSYLGVQSELMGKNASLDVKTGYLTRGSQLLDINYNTVQRGKKTNCQMSFDGVLDGKAQKAFRGTIDFRKGSKGAVGNEQENVLLLSDDVVNKTLPVILCEEEDVEGRHGASIGQLDEDMLFYMASRGIDEKAAEQIMVRARLGAVYREIPDEKLKSDIHDYIERAFAQ